MAGPPATPMSFSGRAGEFFGMLVRGTLLLIPTFGFYRFWLVTRLRRHLWANTRIGDEGFEYLGTAKEILIGFLMALAILTPVYLAYFLVGLYLEEQKAFASLALVAFLWALGHFAVYRGRRYRVKRTAFRGVRFWMDGSGLAYAGRAILWDVFTVLTLFIAFPWRMAALERYKMRHSHFGSLDGRFTATGMDLFRHIWPFGLLIVGVLIGAGLLNGWASSAVLEGKVDTGGFMVVSSVSTALVWLSGVACMVVIYTRMLRWWLSGLRLGEVSIRSDFRVGGVLRPSLWLFVGVLVWSAIVVALGAGIVFGVGGSIESLMAAPTATKAVAVFAAVALLYLVWMLGFGVLARQFLARGIWANVVRTSAVVNIAAFEMAVAAGSERGNGLDQGFADLLDAGGI